MRARLRRKSLDAIEINDQKPGKPRQRERIEGLFSLHTGKITQTQRAQLELFPLFCGRQKNGPHSLSITELGYRVGNARNLRFRKPRSGSDLQPNVAEGYVG